MIEPSDDERADLPVTTQEYLVDLEDLTEQLQDRSRMAVASFALSGMLSGMPVPRSDAAQRQAAEHAFEIADCMVNVGHGKPALTETAFEIGYDSMHDDVCHKIEQAMEALGIECEVFDHPEQKTIFTLRRRG